MSTSLDVLDRYYASKLGCEPEHLRGPGLVVVGDAGLDVRFAKGYPLAVLGVGRNEGAAICCDPRLDYALKDIVHLTNAASLCDDFCDAVEEKLAPMVAGGDWFRGYRYYCDASSFRDCSQGNVRLVTDEDDKARNLHRIWGGDVYGQIVDGRVVCWCAIKPLYDSVWDLSIQTLQEYRGFGYAKSTASAALKAVFESGRIAVWATDRINTASQRTASAVGFQQYGLDFGCIIR